MGLYMISINKMTNEFNKKNIVSLFINRNYSFHNPNE